MLGLGHDVVNITNFREQLTQSGTRILQLFSTAEQRQVALRAQQKHDETYMHYAAKWAGKEAFLKAWCQALHTVHGSSAQYPFTLDSFPWQKVEILNTSHGVPQVILSETLLAVFTQSLARSNSYSEQSATADLNMREPQIFISLSHDEPVASAIVYID